MSGRPSRLSAQPRQGRLHQRHVREQRSGRAPVQGGGLQARPHARHRTLLARRRQSADAGRTDGRARHGVEPAAARRRGMAHGDDRPAGFRRQGRRRASTSSCSPPSPTRHGKAGSGEDGSVRRRPSGVRPRHANHQERPVPVGLRHRQLQQPQRIPLRRCGRRATPVRWSMVPSEASAPATPEQGKSQDKSYLFDDMIARLAPRAAAMASHRHARATRRCHQRPDGALARRSRARRRWHADNRSCRNRSARQLPRHRLRSPGAAVGHRAVRRPHAERQIGYLLGIPCGGARARGRRRARCRSRSRTEARDHDDAASPIHAVLAPPALDDGGAHSRHAVHRHRHGRLPLRTTTRSSPSTGRWES